MESIDKCLHVIKASFEVRNSKESTSRYYSDLEAFRRGSMCDTEPLHGTPTNKVLIHLFAIACNDYLMAASLPPLPGPIWNLDYSVTLGFLSMINSSDDFLEKTRLNESLVKYEYTRAQNYSGVCLLPNSDTTIVYRKSSSELEILFNFPTSSQNTLLTWSGVSGWLRYYPISYMFTSSGEPGNQVHAINQAHLVNCDNATTYSIHGCGDTTGHIKLGGNALSAGTWVPFQHSVHLSCDVVCTSGIVLEYVINSYMDATEDNLFAPVPIKSMGDLRFLPELSNTTFGVIYTKFISYISNKAGASNPYPEILGIVEPNRATNPLINIILLLSNLISD